MLGKILIVEDEPLIALGIEQDLEEAGFIVVGVCGTVEEALFAVETQNFDAVTLDGNLFGKTAEPVADRLTSLNIPYVVLSGYSSDQVGDWIKSAPRLNKPYIPDDLVFMIKDLIKQRTAKR